MSNIMIKKIFLYAFLFFFASLALAAQASTMKVNTSQKCFTVTLPANPTTGYQWTVLHYDKKLFTLSKSHYQHSKTHLIGSGGEMLFTFTLKQRKSFPKQSDILFKYSRSWEKEGGSQKEVTIKFVRH